MQNLSFKKFHIKRYFGSCWKKGGAKFFEDFEVMRLQVGKREVLKRGRKMSFFFVPFTPFGGCFRNSFERQLLRWGSMIFIFQS